jgi:peptide/nickel transport system substrate-binding protein
LECRFTRSPLEFQAVMARIFDTYDYEAAVLGLVSGDADPNPEIDVWTSGGATHLWALTEKNPTTDWQAEIDRLMRAQTSMLDYQKRIGYRSLSRNSIL